MIFKIKGGYKVYSSKKLWVSEAPNGHKSYHSDISVAIWRVYQWGLLDNNREEIVPLLYFARSWVEEINKTFARIGIKIVPNKGTTLNFMKLMEKIPNVDNKIHRSSKRRKSRSK